MNTHKLKLGGIIFLLGFLGVLSLLGMGLPEDMIPAEVRERFSPLVLQLLTMINPLVLMLIMTVVGTILYDKVHLSVPTVERFVGIRTDGTTFAAQIKCGIGWGLIAGLLISLLSAAFYPFLPAEFIEFGNSIELSPLTRFGYGGLTEEILMRYGLMTFVIWLIFKVSKKLNSATYWTGIIIAAVLFALGHFPAAFAAVESPSASLIAYILLGNTVGGLIFGYLYWKKGLEAAFIAHIFTHVAMLIGEPLLGLH